MQDIFPQEIGKFEREIRKYYSGERF